MKLYKLNNIIKKNLLEYFKNEEIKKMKFSYSLLYKLFTKYCVHEFIINNYCCYGEDICCWTEVESSWEKNLDKDISEKALNFKMLNTLKKIIKFTFKGSEFKRNIFIAENNEIILYCFPMRDINKEDIFISFDKTKILVGK